MQPTKFHNTKGFTLIEAVSVLVLLGIITVVAVGVFRQSGRELVNETDVFASHIRYVQARALNDVGPWILEIQNSGSQYRILNPQNQSIRVPGTNATVRDFQEGVSSADTLITFDQWGRPLGATSPITVTLQRGGQSRQIQIFHETGFVQ